MQNFKGKWITTACFAEKKTFNVFFRQLEGLEYSENMPQNKHILFRKKFKTEKFARALLRISADDYYKLYVNGRFVTQGVAPCYSFKQYYNEIDLTAYLQEGQNLIAVHTYYFGVPNRVCVSGDLQHGLLFDLYVDGKLALCTDESFQCAEHDGYVGEVSNKHKTQFMETYDSRSPFVGFEKISYDDSAWEQAKERAFCQYTMVKQPTKQLEMYSIEPKFVRKTTKGLFIDVGREIVGNLVLKARGKRGDTLVFHYGEELDEEGNVRFELRCKCYYEEKWILSGGVDELDFWDYKGFRYAEIEIPNGVEILSLSVLVRHYPYNEIRSYTGSDERERAVFELCRDTVKYGVQECFIDCPTREKGQYFMDGVYIGLSQAALTGDTAMLQKMLRDAFDTAFIDECFMAGGPNAYMQEIAEVPLLIVCACWAEYLFSKDKQFLQENYERVKTLFKEIKKRYSREDGLITIYDKWNLVDWPANCRDGYDCELTQGQECKETHNVLNGYYIEALRCLNAMARTLGEAEDKEYERVKQSYFKAFFEGKTGLFKDREKSSHCSLPSNAIALLIDVGITQRVKEKILFLIKEKRLTSSNIFISPIVLLGLWRVGEEGLARELIADEENWLNMIKEGGTTTFEAFSKSKKSNASLFHPVFAFPVLFLAGLDLKKYFDRCE